MRFVTQTTPETQVILLTAHGSLESAIEALRQGARDYLLKPSSPGQILESVARGLSARKELDQKQRLLEQLEISVQQLRGIESPAPSTSEKDIHSIGDGIQVDLARREIYHANIQVILTPTEGRLMKLFLENRAHLFTHRELVFLLQGYETNEWEAPGILRPIISRLRKKLNRLPGGSEWIVSIRGTGYLFDPGEVNEK